MNENQKIIAPVTSKSAILSGQVRVGVICSIGAVVLWSMIPGRK